MEPDATNVPSGETIETELCIIGAGPAGLVVAAELAAAGHDVLVVESGDRRGDPRAQALAQARNDGDTVGDPYAGLQVTRHRGVGGTTLLWNTPTPRGAGAKYVPLDPWDFLPRWPEAPDGWPLAYEDLVPFYVRAQRLCGLGAMAYDAESWATPDMGPRTQIARASAPAPAPIDLGAGDIVSRVYQMGARATLLEPLLSSIRRAPAARLCTDATVVQLTDSPHGATVTVARTDGGRWTVRARRVVLAAGAVENARLLLLAAETGERLRDRSGWLGRGFMEHPRDHSLTLHLAPGMTHRALAFYDAHAGRDGATIIGRLALSEPAARNTALLNASATLLPRPQAWRARVRDTLGGVGIWRAWRRWLPAPGHGWSTHPAVDRVFHGVSVLLNVEQPPHRENAIVLGRRRDAFGTPLPELHWRWSAEDHARLGEVRAVVARALERGGLGRVERATDASPDPNAHHHAGTTRMHADWRHGVVDADGRLHGADAIYVTGASCFPTAGFANPMLTIVAMALRLADHLRAT